MALTRLTTAYQLRVQLKKHGNVSQRIMTGHSEETGLGDTLLSIWKLRIFSIKNTQLLFHFSFANQLLKATRLLLLINQFFF